MKKQHEYNVVVFPHYRYATLDCSEQYTNVHFDECLALIAKYYFKDMSAGPNHTCTLIRDEINSEWHLNGFRASIRRKRVSTNQIKTIRRSFNKLKNKEENFVRLPFDVVPIFFFIMSLLAQISEESGVAKEFISRMNVDNVRNYIYPYQSEVFRQQYETYMNNLTDPVLRAKFMQLHANLFGPDTFMIHRFSEIVWNDIEQYRIR